MADDETLKVYDARAEQYSRLVARPKPDADLLAFMDAVTPGGRVLDLGCGPGNSAAAMRDHGFEAEASDASPEMVALARDTYGINARCESFDALVAEAVYDGIWANFSLLHVPRAAFSGHLRRIVTALKPGGIFHIGMKLGQGAGRDTLGRYYTYYGEEELGQLLNAQGLVPFRTRKGREAGLSGEVSPFAVMLCRKGGDA